MNKILFFLGAIVLANLAYAQSEKGLLKYLKSDIEYLASDELEGRLAGSESEKLAAEYIAKRFKKIGLSVAPKNIDYYHLFEFNTPLKLAENGNTLGSKEKSVYFEMDKDFYVVPISGNGNVNAGLIDITFGINAPELNYNNLENLEIEGKVVLLNLGSPDGIHPHSKFKNYQDWRQRVDRIITLNPAAIILQNSQTPLSLHALRSFTNLSRANIPIVYLEKNAVEKLITFETVAVQTQLIQESKESRNVLGYLDMGAKRTVVIGAHFDHLGYGEYGNSLYTGPAQIHNGADDNASGVALMLALAQKLVSHKNQLKHNYLFLAFSAEELGLLGSKAFVNSTIFSQYNPLYMMNFDMVGRLNEKNELGLFGTGTSSAWDSVIANIDTNAITLNRNPSGMGSSDHTAFYLNKIPSIHLFTGSHEDYHKPSDDAEKINYLGMQTVMHFAYAICLELDKNSGINYKKTKTGSSRKAPSFKVTLGIIPDYFGNEAGLKIDGVSTGKPAEKAGLIKGDIITKLGDMDVKDMMTYMSALAKFDIGDKTIVELLRNGEVLKLEVEF